MNYVIPVLGKGERFLSYKEDKPFINVNGKTMIEMVVEPILSNKNNLIWIFCRFDLLDKLNKLFHNERIKIIPLQETSGAAETLFYSCLYIPSDEPFTSIDCDTVITAVSEKLISKNKKNCIYTFIDDKNQGIFSYILPNGKYITTIKEKEVISNIASSGVYQFSSAKKYIEIFKKAIIHLKTAKELYISYIINFAINNKIKFEYKNIDNEFICLGTPYQLEKYIKENIELKTFVFDLDRTLIEDTNTNPVGILKNIEFCNGLYNLGHKIIIHTSRGMLSNNNNVQEIEKKYRKKIENILAKNNIKYNELIFGKPFADIYIDDKSINSFDDLNKKSGFYSGIKFDSRYMHNIIDNGNTVIKTGSSVVNEKYYYRNIPEQLKKYFPTIYDCSNDNQIVMEKINGISASEMLLNLQLTKENIFQIVNSLSEIHNFEKINSASNWFYGGKLLERYYANINLYNKLEISEKEITKLIDSVKVNKDSIIHGDSVFTNIFFTSDSKIKLIDPRGKNCSNNTIYGATCYDFAKMLQSLYGYDFIISGSNIPDAYLSLLREYFFSIINEDMAVLKQKTKILILSMLPLHIDRPDRIIKFVELYRKIS